MPVILAAGRAPRLGRPQALARFGPRTALEIALGNCAGPDAIGAGMAAPVVVLGWQAAKARRAVSAGPGKVGAGTRIVRHRHWREGQLSSLRAGLRFVPRDAAVLLYPVDFPLLTPGLFRRLVRAFRQRARHQEIVMPVWRGLAGHPVIFSPAVRRELLRARTAREVVEKDPGRVRRVPVRTAAVCMDFDTRAEYRRCRRAYLRARRSD